jgi:uncharacterized protein GlcG (DUF336 family)
MQEMQRETEAEMRVLRNALDKKSSPSVDDRTNRGLSLDLSLDLARSALNACREKGHRVTSTVTDHQGREIVMLRDDGGADRPQLMNSKKVGLVVGSGLSSRQRLEQQEARMRGFGLTMSDQDKLELPGAVPLRVGGKLIGVLAVSGAPNGRLDETCALAAVGAIGGLDQL